jgi:hypothetical protein
MPRIFFFHAILPVKVQMRSIYDDLECLPPAHPMTGRGSGDAPQGPKQGDPAGPAGGTAAAAPGTHILVDCAGEGDGLATKGERSS